MWKFTRRSYDPVEVFAEGGALASSGGQMSAPHFFLKADDVSPGNLFTAQA